MSVWLFIFVKWLDLSLRQVSITQLDWYAGAALYSQHWGLQYSVSDVYDQLIISLAFFPSDFLQYFDTVGWVFWPVKTVSHITYTVLEGTLNTAQSNQTLQSEQ